MLARSKPTMKETTNNQPATPTRQVSGTKALRMFIQQNLPRQKSGIALSTLGNLSCPIVGCLQA
eukprot:9781285-Ditylum_brightwellii.AAC.1